MAAANAVRILKEFNLDQLNTVIVMDFLIMILLKMIIKILLQYESEIRLFLIKKQSLELT